MEFIYLMIGTGVAAIAVAIWVTIYEHNRSRHLETD